MKKKIFITLVVLILVIVGVSVVFDNTSKIGINQGYEPDQPILFSHKIHAGDNKIQCLNCHTGAEKSRHAGIPSANVCMTCHTNIKKDSPEILKIKEAIENNKPIEWVKVHRMADFVYFNHAQHVSLGKVSCQKCHGAVESMTRMKQENTLTMGWCLDCHKQSDVVVHDDKIVKESDIGGTDCAKCHY